MKKYINKKNIIILLVLITIVYFVFQPSLPKKLLERIKKELVQDDLELRKEIDSIKSSIIADKEKYLEDILQKNKEINEVTLRLKDAQLKIRRYEIQILDYRNSTYNERFVVFTKLITEADTIQK